MFPCARDPFWVLFFDPHPYQLREIGSNCWNLSMRVGVNAVLQQFLLDSSAAWLCGEMAGQKHGDQNGTLANGTKD